jgi:hypothetical protein
MELAMIFGKDNMHQHYSFLKVFSFSFGGDAERWYSSLTTKSISSKEECLRVFFTQKYRYDKALYMIAAISKFTQNK